MANRQQLLTFTCAFHGPFQAWTGRGEISPCRCGCDPCFVEPCECPLSSLPTPPPPPPARRPARPPATPDELMPAEEVRAALRQLLAEAPYGGKRPIALALGFRGQWALHSLRSIAIGHGHLYEAVRRRLSHRLRQLQRGQLTLVPTGLTGAGKRLYTVVVDVPEATVR